MTSGLAPGLWSPAGNLAVVTADRLPPGDEEFRAAIDLIEGWLHETIEPVDAVAAVERDTTAGQRWFVRLNGVEKDVYSVWLWLHQRRLHMEAYILPSPEEQRERVFEYLLRRNRRSGNVRLCLGDEDAVFVCGEMAIDAISDDALDELFGAVVETVEAVFRPAIRMGFASRFTTSTD